ncbi:MAG TPA: choice-of-anchor I family protein, partial [Ohtaekwangia sp.]
MRKIYTLMLLTSVVYLSSCEYWPDGNHPPQEGYTYFTQIGSVELAGGSTAAEISAYDSKTKKLFVVNAVKSAIDVINMQDPYHLVYEQEISITPYGAGVNSVSVKNGLLAAAIESNPKTDAGKVVVWNTADLSERAAVTVGALPDMVAFSPDGKFIVSANEGEPNEDYTIDPKGSISIIRVPGYAVTTLDFTSFNNQAASLITKGFRMPGPAGTTLAQDTEPEYVAISSDSRTAWITLQENNSVARVDLSSKKIDKIFPLGYLDHSKASNSLDPSDRNAGVLYGNFPVRGLYLPDAIAAFQCGGSQLFITANEGDSRLRPTSDDALPPLEEGELFNEESRVKDVTLDATVFPNAAELRTDAKLGRLKITNRQGDTDGDGDYDQLYSFGTRSFTIRNGLTNQIVYESGAALEE